MKIKMPDRILLIVCAVVLILGAVYVAAFPSLHETLYNIILAVLMVAAAAYLVLLPTRYRVKSEDYVTQQNENGELRISLHAVENLVDKCIDVHDEINVADRAVTNDHRGVLVDLNVSLANNISIPLAVSSLQKQIRQYVMAASGVEVRDVRVTVQMTEDPISRDASPFAVDHLEAPEKPLLPVHEGDDLPAGTDIPADAPVEDAVTDETPSLEEAVPGTDEAEAAEEAGAEQPVESEAEAAESTEETENTAEDETADAPDTSDSLFGEDADVLPEEPDTEESAEEAAAENTDEQEALE